MQESTGHEAGTAAGRCAACGQRVTAPARDAGRGAPDVVDAAPFAKGGADGWNADGSDTTDDPAAEVPGCLGALRYALDELRVLQEAERRRHEAAWARQAEALDGLERVVRALARRLRREIAAAAGGRRPARRAGRAETRDGGTEGAEAGGTRDGC